MGPGGTWLGWRNTIPRRAPVQQGARLRGRIWLLRGPVMRLSHGTCASHGATRQYESRTPCWQYLHLVQCYQYLFYVVSISYLVYIYVINIHRWDPILLYRTPASLTLSSGFDIFRGTTVTYFEFGSRPRPMFNILDLINCARGLWRVQTTCHLYLRSSSRGEIFFLFTVE